MHEHRHSFPGLGPGTTHQVLTLSFGDPDARPHVHIQGGLHADEGPGMMVARLLADRLADNGMTGDGLAGDGLAGDGGRLRGHVTIVPCANPIGLGQVLLGDHVGRFDLQDGRNFNRDYPDLAQDAGDRVADHLGQDAAANVALIRSALRAALRARRPVGPADLLRHHLMGQAIQADVVLDLHCDGEAVMHLYTQPDALERLMPLAALTGCRAVLLAQISGGRPFDEALSGPWRALAARFPDHPIPLGCATTTLELRGRADVDRDLGAADAQAILDYLTHLGVLSGSVDLPPPVCDPTPLAGSEALTTPVAGLVSYAVPVGATVAAGATVAHVTDPETGRVTAIRAGTAGVVFARPATRIAEPGKCLAKIAGDVPFRDGLLLGP